jgi:sec-independent protein translocase protein TatB
MFDFDIGKLMVVGIVALAVIPPKDLPRVMRTVGQVVGKMRRMAAEFQGQFMDAMKEADLDSVKKEFEQLEQAAKVDTSFDPAIVMRDEITQAAEPPKTIDAPKTIVAPTVDALPPPPAPSSAEVVVKPPSPSKAPEPAQSENAAASPAK